MTDAGSQLELSIALPSESADPTASTLSAVPSTLRIPLAARALGDELFPAVAVQDAYAKRALAALGDDGAQWLNDRPSVYGVLARTRCFRTLAEEFLKGHPGAQVTNLGCGLSHYFQWLDDGQARMTDADLPEVLALRRTLLPSLARAPAADDRYALRELDLTYPGWWDRLGLPGRDAATPAFLLSEGVFMYLAPSIVMAALSTFGERAPAGSVLAFDAMCWLAAGRAKYHPSVKHTAAEFRWGPRRPRDLLAAHPRLRLSAIHPVMEGYGWPYSVIGPVSRLLLRVPFYALYVLRTSDEAAAGG